MKKITSERERNILLEYLTHTIMDSTKNGDGMGRALVVKHIVTPVLIYILPTGNIFNYQTSICRLIGFR